MLIIFLDAFLKPRYKSASRRNGRLDVKLKEHIMTDKTPNYSAAQVALILAAVAANGGVANKSVAAELASDPRMDGEKGERNTRSIIAKMTRMPEIDYQRQVSVSKTGEPVAKKTALVGRIAALADVSASKLDGLDKAPKLALETLVRAFAA